MAASSKWACLPLLSVAAFISLASAARIFPLDTDDHSSISTSTPSDDLAWMPVTGVKRKLYVSPLQHDNTAISFPLPSPKWLDEKGEGLMSDEDVGTETVFDGEVDDEDNLFRHSSDEEIDELMDHLEDVGMDDTNAGSSYGWGSNQGGGSSNGWQSGGIGGGGGGDESDGGGGASGSSGDSDGSTGGIGWSWGGGGTSGSGHIGRGGISIGGNGGSGRNSWHWAWHWGGGGSKVAAANDPNPKNGASGMSSDTDIANAPAPMSN